MSFSGSIASAERLLPQWRLMNGCHLLCCGKFYAECSQSSVEALENFVKREQKIKGIEGKAHGEG